MIFIYQKLIAVFLLLQLSGFAFANEPNDLPERWNVLATKYDKVLKQAATDRANKPNAYVNQLELLDRSLQNAMLFASHTPSPDRERYLGAIAGVAGGPLSMSMYGDGEQNNKPNSKLTVPFLFEMIIKGPPQYTNGICKDPFSGPLKRDASRSGGYKWHDEEYDLMTRYLSIGLIGKYEDPNVLILLNDLVDMDFDAEVKSFASHGLYVSMNPKAVDILLKVLTIENKEVRIRIWTNINYMTSRRLVWGEDPTKRQIAEFRTWWKDNKQLVINQYYNKDKERLEPVFKSPNRRRR